MTIEDLIKCYSNILSNCEKELPDYEDDAFARGYCHGQIETYKLVIRDLKEFKELEK